MIVGHLVFVVLAGPAWDAVRNRTKRDRAKGERARAYSGKGVDYMERVWRLVKFLTFSPFPVAHWADAFGVYL
jgi:hypothetical protein